jgi:hypothetical protein
MNGAELLLNAYETGNDVTRAFIRKVAPYLNLPLSPSFEAFNDELKQLAIQAEAALRELDASR